jgi:hypothetical protein
MSQRYARRNQKEAHTVSRIARPVCIASAGGNDYRVGVRDVEHSVGGLGHTMPIAWPRAAVAETLERADTRLLSDLMILSLPRNLLKARACSWRERGGSAGGRSRVSRGRSRAHLRRTRASEGKYEGESRSFCVVGGE